MNCPCSSGQSYDRCCGRFISQAAAAANAEQLMRSRFSAYALGHLDYLKSSWHPRFRPPDLKLEPKLRWLGLDLIDFTPAGDSATVEFEARWLAGGIVDALHESSRFVREDGRWLYTDGDRLPPSFAPWKPGRNEACPCGSGRKFKRCCGAA